MKRISKAVLAAAILLVPLSAGAITLLPTCTATGNCGISDILAVFINLAELLLGIVGAVALGYFVYGGFVFILSRGNKGEVDRAFGILRSAVIGIFIIFLSGVFVRFTTQALTGGTSAIPTIGETCDPVSKKSVKQGAGLWVSIPSGVKDGKVIPEGLECVKKDADCGDLNTKIEEHGRTERYSCMKIESARTCVRGLCLSGGSDVACCLK